MLPQYTPAGPGTAAHLNLNEDERRRLPVLVALLVLTLLYGFGGTALTGSVSPTQETPAGRGALTASVLDQRAREYFAAWNSHDAGKLRQMFQEGGTLRDWDVNAQGASRVVEANSKVWREVPGIAIEIVGLHPSPATRTVACEIVVRLNDLEDTALRVADMIEFGADHRIVSLRAYKG